MLALAAISLYPTIDGVDASLHRFRYGLDQGFTGLDNFSIIYGDQIFWRAILTTVLFVIVAVAIETLLGLLLALLVARELRFAGLIRVALILPMTIAPVVVGVIWRLLYASDIGIVNPLFELFGFEGPNILAHPLTAFFGLVAVDTWEWTPLLFLIILAGLHSLPQDPIEAARVDGATGFRLFFHVNFPLIANLYLICTLLSTIFSLGDFNAVFFVSGGGPANSTHVLATLGIRYAFDMANPYLGVASVMTALPLLIPLVIILMRKFRTSQVQL